MQNAAVGFSRWGLNKQKGPSENNNHGVMQYILLFCIVAFVNI